MSNVNRFVYFDTDGGTMFIGRKNGSLVFAVFHGPLYASWEADEKECLNALRFSLEHEMGHFPDIGTEQSVKFSTSDGSVSWSVNGDASDPEMFFVTITHDRMGGSVLPFLRYQVSFSIHINRTNAEELQDLFW